MVVRKLLIHQFAPFTEKLPFEVTERERDTVTFHALYPAYYEQDFKGLFYYGVGNVVVFIFVTIHSANLLRVKGILGNEERRQSVHSSGPRKAYNIDRCRPYGACNVVLAITEFPRFEDRLTQVNNSKYAAKVQKKIDICKRKCKSFLIEKGELNNRTSFRNKCYCVLDKKAVILQSIKNALF
jgi:hypothetical protein